MSFLNLREPLTTAAISLLTGIGITMVLPLRAIAQTDSGCFMIDPSGQYVDLSYLCNTSEPQPQTADIVSNTVPILTPVEPAPVVVASPNQASGFISTAFRRVDRMTNLATPGVTLPSNFVWSSPLRLRSLPIGRLNSDNSLQTIIIDSPTRINTVGRDPVRLRTLNNRLSTGFEGTTIYQSLPESGVNYFTRPIYR